MATALGYHLNECRSASLDDIRGMVDDMLEETTEWHSTRASHIQKAFRAQVQNAGTAKDTEKLPSDQRAKQLKSPALVDSPLIM